MKNLKFIAVAILMLITITGCVDQPEQNSSGVDSMLTDEHAKFSDNILFSINNGAAGFGTIAECTDAEIIVYTDKTISVFMPSSDFAQTEEIASITISDNDYEKLSEIADREKIYNLNVYDGEGCDGASSYIKLYDENDKQLVYKGGYMAVGEEFWEIYKSIKEIINTYDISDIVDEHRKTLE